MSDEIAVVAKEIGRDFGKNLLFGTLPTGRVNGMAIGIPNCAYCIILLEEGLFGFANLAAKAIVRAFPFHRGNGGDVFRTDDESVKQQIAASPELPARFMDLLAAYLIGGTTRLARAYLPDRAHHRLSSVIRDGVELFVLGHEHGHCIAGHLDACRPTRRLAWTDNEMREIASNWRDELVADVHGVELMIGAMGNRGCDISLSYSGADFFFSCVEVIEKALSLLRSGTYANEEQIASKTHPPPAMRREKLREGLGKAIPEEHLRRALGLSDSLRKVLDIYWTYCEPILLDLHRKGIQLAPGWRAGPIGLNDESVGTHAFR
jgi:hypothetical protein